MAKMTADVLFERLIDWGVDVIFGLPGDGINGFIEALRTHQDRIRFVQVRHEEARVRRVRLRQVLRAARRLHRHFGARGDPSPERTLRRQDGWRPVLAITGQTYHDLIGMRTSSRSICSSCSRTSPSSTSRSTGRCTPIPWWTPHVAALRSRGVAHINCCNDWQEKSTSDGVPSQMNVTGHTSKAWTPPIVIPQVESLKRAAGLLNGGTKTVILAGQGAMGAGEELERIADTLAAPIVKALLGKAVVPDDSPYTTGSIGLLGTLPSEKAMEECDTLLIAGSSFPYMQYLARVRPSQGRAD